MPNKIILSLEMNYLDTFSVLLENKITLPSVTPKTYHAYG